MTQPTPLSAEKEALARRPWATAGKVFPLVFQAAGWTLIGIVGLIGFTVVLANLETMMTMLRSSKPSTVALFTGEGKSPAIDIFVAVVGILGIACLLSIRAGKSAGIELMARPARTAPAAAVSMAGWTALVATSMLLVATLSSWVSPLLSQGAQTTAGAQWRDLDLGIRAWYSVYAGVMEELAYVAIPFALAAFVLNRVTMGPRMRVALLCVTAAIAMAMRITIHAYQGPAYAYGAALWSLGNILVFLASRSVIPLILAHTFFDFVLAGGLWDSDWALPILALAATASVVALVRQHRGYRECPLAAIPARQ